MFKEPRPFSNIKIYVSRQKEQSHSKAPKKQQKIKNNVGLEEFKNPKYKAGKHLIVSAAAENVLKQKCFEQKS